MHKNGFIISGWGTLTPEFVVLSDHSRFNTTNSKIVWFKEDNSVSFDKKNRYMSKIHAILVVLSMYFLKNGVNFESNLFSNEKNIPISVFGYFIIHKLNIQKRGKNEKLIEEIYLKLILNIVNFLCCKKSISVSINSYPSM